MKSKLELFKTDEVIGRIIKGSAEPKDFRLFEEIFRTNKILNDDKDGILYSLKDSMSQKAFHQLVSGLLKENKEFVVGRIPNNSSLAGKVLRIEARMHQSDLKKDDSNIQKSLNIIMSHYPTTKVSDDLIHSAVETIYAPLISKANPYEGSRNGFEEYYYDSSSIGSDYGPTQEEIDRSNAEQYREQQNHEEKVSELIYKAYNLSITDKNKSLINSKLDLNDQSKGDLESFKEGAESVRKLPKEVHDPLERRAVAALNEEIIPQINKLAKAANSKFKNDDIDRFMEKVGNVLVSAGVNDFNKQNATEELKETYAKAAQISNVSARDKLLYSISSIFKQSSSNLLNKLGDHCYSKIGEDSAKILANNKRLKHKTSEVLANALNTKGIAGSIRDHLINLEQESAKPSHIAARRPGSDKNNSQLRG